MYNPLKFLFCKPIGFPLGQHVPANPADHAENFAHRYADELDWHASLRMETLGIPKDRIGSSDHDHGIKWCAFNPFERDGAGLSTGGRINLDSGALNPELITDGYGRRAGTLWAKSRLRDRQDALIAHEEAEWRAGGDHDVAVKTAPFTDLPISDQAREILNTMERGWRGR